MKAGAVMRGGEYGVCLVPQHFHNVIHPDALDHANYDMVNKLEFAFAGGILLLTGMFCLYACDCVGARGGCSIYNN